ncbi:hypothetical protein BGZ94_006284 [Podila epigama]|nr:hypothetical protein BGZ94_006284 [Podila epigama]
MSSSSSSSSAATSRTTQYTVLNAALDKLRANLEVLEGNVEETMVQSEWTKRLTVIHSSLFMAASTVLKDEGTSHEEDRSTSRPPEST